VTGTGSDLGKSYVAFVRGNMDQIAKKISDDLLVLSTMEVREKARPFWVAGEKRELTNLRICGNKSQEIRKHVGEKSEFFSVFKMPNQT
jgi:hypothetical protein